MNRPSILIFATALSGCATLTRGTTETVVFTSEPRGAKARLSNGMVCEETPCQFELPRRDGFSVVFSKPGYHDKEVNVGTKMPAMGGVALAGNVVAGGIVGGVVDYNTGAAWEFSPNPVAVTLEPEHFPAPPAPAVVRRLRGRGGPNS